MSTSDMRSQMHDGAQGCFAVKFSMVDGDIAAVLIDHFKSTDAHVANAVAGCDLLSAMSEYESPTYLVPDSIMSLAAELHDRDVEPKLNAVTTIVINGVKLPDSDLSKKLKVSLADTIGMFWSDAHWEGEMTEEKVEEVFNVFGASHEKEEER